MSLMNDLLDNAKHLSHKPLAVIGLAAATLTGGAAKAQSTGYKSYNQIEQGERMPGFFLSAGYQQRASNHSLFNGGNINLEARAGIGKKRIVQIEGSYGYQLNNPATIGFGYQYQFQNPFNFNLVQRGAGAYSFSPSQTRLGFNLTTPPSSPLEANVGVGLHGIWMGGVVWANGANPYAKAQVGYNLGDRNSAVNLFVGAKVEALHVNQSLFNLTRYYDADKQNVVTFGVEAGLRFNPKKLEPGPGR